LSFDAGAVIGRLELNIAGWQKSVETVKKDQTSLSGLVLRHEQDFKALGKTLTVVGAAITASMGMMIKKTADYGDEMDEMHQRTGASVELLTGLDGALRKNGASAQDLAVGMKFLSGKMVDANNGNKDAIKLFEDLGISIHDTSTGELRPMTDVLFDVATKFKGMEDGAKKTTFSVDLLGKGGMKLIPTLNLGADGLKKEADQATRLGKVLTAEAAKACSDFNDALVDLGGGVQGVFMQIGMSLIPSLQGLIKGVTEIVVKVIAWGKEHPGLVKGLSEVTLGIGVFLSILGPLMLGMVAVIKNMAAIKIALGILQGGFAALISPVGLATAGVIALLIAIAPGKTIAEKFGAVLEAVTQTIKVWTQAVREANEIIGGSWFAKSFKMEIAQQMAEAKKKAVEFAASLKVLKPSMDAIQQTMERGPAVWKEWSTSVKATDAILAANKETIIKWIDKGAVWLGLAKDMGTGGYNLGEVLKALGVKTKTELTKELDAAEKALEEFKRTTEATPGQVKVLQDKIIGLKDGMSGLKSETKSLAEQLGITFRADAEARIKKLNDALLLYRGLMTEEQIAKIRSEIESLSSSMKLSLIPAADAVSQHMDIALSKLEEVALAAMREIEEVGDYTVDQMASDLDEIAKGWKKIPDGAKKPLQDTTDYFAGMLNDIARGFGDAISKWCQGLTTFRDFMAEIWGNIKDAFFRVIGQMIAEWMVKFITALLVSIGIINPAIASIGATAAASATVATASFATMAAAAGAFLTTLAAIAIAVTALLGLFGLLGDSFPYIPGAPTIGNGYPAPGRGRGGEGERPGGREPREPRTPRGDNFAAGGIAWTPQWASLGERKPEIIGGLDDYLAGRPLAGIPQPGLSGGRGPGAGGPVVNNYHISIQAIDGPSVERLFKTQGREIIDEMFRQNRGGLTRNVNRYLEAIA